MRLGKIRAFWKIENNLVEQNEPGISYAFLLSFCLCVRICVRCKYLFFVEAKLCSKWPRQLPHLIPAQSWFFFKKSRSLKLLQKAKGIYKIVQDEVNM